MDNGKGGAMGEVRAFVGHSFTDDDAQVVGTFLKYFEQLARLNPNFSWQHAENAEPRQLAEKVLQLIADKNVFIGICTKKEAALPSTAATPMWLRRDHVSVKRQAITWKTSDWIIQEIGLAIGKSLDLILLIENGVRPPGGLQGNVEYIPFDRATPEKSFGKIAEMITALSPAVSQTSVQSPDPSSTAVAETSHPSAEDDWNIPKATWKRRDYEHAMWRAIIFKDDPSISSLNERYLETDHASTEENRDSWFAFREYTSLLFGKGGTLAHLREFAEKHPKNSRVLSYYARGLDHHEKHEKAANVFSEAATKAPDADEGLRLLGQAAVSSARASELAICFRLLNQMRDVVATMPKKEIQLLATLQEVAQIRKIEDLELAAMERRVDIDPDNVDLRYTLAYRHSERGNRDLALAHYLEIPFDERTAAAWNNLGVELQNASLKGKSVSAYRRSEEMGGSLAMSNLARLLSRAGFLTEAEQLCNKALKLEDYDKNVLGTLERLKDIPEEESKKQADLIEKSKPASEFYGRFGHAASMQYADGIEGQWQGPQCILDVAITNGEFVAVGSYKVARARSGLLYRGLMEPALSDVVHKIEYRGPVHGHTVEAEIAHTSDDSTTGLGASLLGGSDKNVRALIVINEARNELSVMEGMGSNSHSFYSLKRL
jgi:tetratricopeptide (TPR) repeat protein